MLGHQGVELSERVIRIRCALVGGIVSPLRVGFEISEISEIHARPHFSACGSGCSSEILQYHACLRASMLPALMIRD